MVKRTTTPIEQTSRLLNLVPFLLTHQGIALDDLAQHFGVSKEVILDDLNTLWMCGLPGYTPLELIDLEFDSGFVTIRNADPLAQVRSLDGSEMVALALGLDLLLTGSGDLSVELSAKIMRLSDLIRERIGGQISISDSGRSEVRSLIERAIKERASVRIHYFSPQIDEIKERTITPFDFIREDSIEYVRAFCQSAGGLRTFRLDRITEISKDLIAYAPTESGSASSDAITAIAQINRGDRSTAESLGLVPTEVLVGGVLSFPAYSLEWITRTVLASRGDLSISTPIEARRSIVQSIESTLALYEDGAIALALTKRK
jgi:proteasome accessory factor C